MDLRPLHYDGNPQPTTGLFILLDAVRLAELAMPEAVGLAEMMWRYSQGVELTAADRDALDLIVRRLRRKIALRP